ncbi:MAG: tetratricopeptide repeat protein, partial [Rhodospirillales bacterium]|nr:tetratricopeptide repeat protein [Rhodospirillales bacterium]
EDFDEALAISPLLPGGLVARGLALEKLGRAKEAESDFEEAARQHPGDWKGWYHLARMLEQRKKLRFAVAGYEKVLELKLKPEIRRELKRRIAVLRKRLPPQATEVRVLVPPFRDKW